MQPAQNRGIDTPAGSDRQYHEFKSMGDCYTGTGEYGKACDCYKRAASIRPGEAGPYVGLGMVAVRTDRPDVAGECFDVALQLQDDCAEAFAGLAMVHQHSGEKEQAFEMYLKCLEHDSENLVALLGLFQTSREMGSFSKIIHYLQVYLEKHPEDTSVLFCLASLYVKEGRLTPARDALEKVLAAEPSKREAAQLLDQVQDALGSLHQVDKVAIT